MGAKEITEGASSLLSSIGHVILAAASEARVEVNDTNVNISKITDGSTNETGLVSGKQRVSCTYIISHGERKKK